MEPEPNPNESTPLRAARVMCVDDDASVRELLVMALNMHGLEAEAYADGHQAWEQLAQDFSKVDLVITDNQMPNLGGFELVQRLREANFPGKIMFYSSSFHQNEGAKVAALRVDSVVEKGSNLAHLLAEIARVLGS